MKDIELLKTDPGGLFDKFMGILMSGGTLTETQLIMLEAAKNMIGKSDGI